MALALAPLAAPLAAQPIAVASDSARAAAVARLAPGAWVRVQLPAGTVTGTVRRADGDTLVLRTTGGHEQALAAGGVQRLWVQEGRSTGAGALYGGIAVGAVGALAGTFLGGFMCETGCARGQTFGAVLGATAGVAAGALAGAAVGSLVPRWRQLHP